MRERERERERENWSFSNIGLAAGLCKNRRGRETVAAASRIGGVGRQHTVECSSRGSHGYTFPTHEFPLPPRTLTSKSHTLLTFQRASSLSKTPGSDLQLTYQLPLSLACSFAHHVVLLVVIVVGFGVVVIGDYCHHHVDVGSNEWRS